MSEILEINDSQLAELVELRHQLHRRAELSCQEESTASLVALELERAGADEVIRGVGGTGVIGVFNSGLPGPVLVLRSELDALPVTEPDDMEIDYCSQTRGISHKCGHDGHMSVLCGVAKALGKRRPVSGKVALLFQPAEETGEGGPAVAQDQRFRALKPDYVIGFHNLPKREMHSIWVRYGTFASASEGFRLKLTGAFSHSSYPEHGRSPAAALATLLAELPGLPGAVNQFSDLLMLTLTQAVLGEKGPKMDFGVAPGVAEICGTVRAHEQQELDALKVGLEELANKVCDQENLQLEVSWHEAFPATVSHDESVDLIKSAAQNAGLQVDELEEPMRWSEDFSHYLLDYPGAFFGLGSGIDQPQLHNEYYDFPDELIPTGVKIYLSIIRSVLEASDARPCGSSA
jgi:amidohydrolase